MAPLSPQIKRRTIGIVCLTVFLDLLGVGILLPVIPQIINPITSLNILPAGWSAAQGAILLGWLTALYPICQFIAAPLLGQLSDRYGRRLLLVVSLAGTAVGYALFAIGLITHNIPLLFVARVIQGLTGGDIAVAQAVIADVSSEHDRAKYFGWAGAAFGLGFILGPFLGGALTDTRIAGGLGLAAPFWFAAVLLFIDVILVWLLLPETRSAPSRAGIRIGRSITQIRTAFTAPGIKDIMPSTFFFMAGFTGFTTFIGLILLHDYALSPIQVGLYFVYFGVWIALIQGVLAGILAKRYRDIQILRLSMIATAVGLLGYIFIPNNLPLLLLVPPPIIALGNGLTLAFMATTLSRLAPPHKYGEVLGINASVMALAQGIPAALAGYMYTINRVTLILVSVVVIIWAIVSLWINFRSTPFSRL